MKWECTLLENRKKQGISDCLKSVKISLISEMQARCSFLVKTTKLVFNSEWIMANFRRFVTSIAVIIMCSAYFLALFSKKIQQLKISEQTLHYWIKNLQQHQSRASGLEMEILYINLNLNSSFKNVNFGRFLINLSNFHGQKIKSNQNQNCEPIKGCKRTAFKAVLEIKNWFHVKSKSE